MVLLIIIPTIHGYFIGGIPHFQTYPLTNFEHQSHSSSIQQNELRPSTFPLSGANCGDHCRMEKWKKEVRHQPKIAGDGDGYSGQQQGKPGARRWCSWGSSQQSRHRTSRHDCAGQVGCQFVAKSRQQLKWAKWNLWIDTKSNCLRIQMFYRHFTLMIFTLPFLVASLRQLEWFQLNPINPINPSDLLARTTSRVVMPTIFIGSRPSRWAFHGKNGGNQRFQWKTTRPQVEFGKKRKTR